MLAWGGALYYVDESDTESIRQEDSHLSDPRPLFNHPELEPGYSDKEILYFQDQKYTQSVIDKKNSSYLEWNYGYSDLTLSSISPFYYPQNYTTTTTVSSTTNGTTSQSNATMTINETFAINSYGTADLSFTQVHTDPTQQYFMQMSAITRTKNLGMGIEMSYNNNPTITLVDPSYTINQTTSSTSTTTTTGDNTTESYPTLTITTKTVNITLNNLVLKVVNIPINLTVQYFPIYDGYFQPFVKVGMGCNFTHTDMTVTENTDSTRGTLTPLYQMGWAFKPFSLTYGGGVQIMLTPSLALTGSYSLQRLDGRSTKFSVIVNDPDNSTLSGTYGDMRFEFKQKTTLKELGLVYYF